jgi:hypothetical protein
MKKLLMFTLAAITFAAAISEAYITPGPRPRPRPPGPVRPGPGPRPPRPYPPPRPDPGSFSVPVYVNRQMYGNDRLDIFQYINAYQYRGYRLVAIDFTASASYNTALIDVLINGFQTGPTVNLSPYVQNFRVFPNGAIYIGQGADSIVLYTRGDLFVQQVVLQLSR